MKDEIDFWQCPYCERRITVLEYDLVRYDFDCMGNDHFNPKKRCPNKLSDYVPRLKQHLEEPNE